MNFSHPEKIKLSIVIASWNGAAMLRECLLSLADQIELAAAEVIVVTNFKKEVDIISKEFTFAEFIVLSPEISVPKLRTAGILQSKGEIIALSEDICTFQNNWCAEIIKAHCSEYSIIGGTVENVESQSPLDWAVFFYDYGKYLPPEEAKIIDALSEMNISYKREILWRQKDLFAEGFSEIFVNQKLKADGYELFLAPAATVFHRKNYEFKAIVSQLSQQSRTFAFRRTENFSFLKRFFFAAISLFLPALLSVRVVLRAVNKKRYLKELLIALPCLIILMHVWAFGELCGYLSSKATARSGNQ